MSQEPESALLNPPGKASETCWSPLRWDKFVGRYTRYPKWIPWPLFHRARWDNAENFVVDRLDMRFSSGWKPGSAIQKSICDAAEEECEWGNPCFVPEDEMAVVFWSSYDCLDYTAAFERLEREYGIEISLEDMDFLMTGTLGLTETYIRVRVERARSTLSTPEQSSTEAP